MVRDIETEMIIKKAQTEILEKIDTLSKDSTLRPVLILASYCTDNPNCTDEHPCDECLGFCNVAFVKKDDISNVVCSLNFVR